MSHALLDSIEDRPSPQQIAIYRAMTPGERLQAAENLNHEAGKLRAAYERSIHPDWTDAHVESHVKRIFLLATT
jgi:hypothetical protein